MSLWTPGGEVPIERNPRSTEATPSDGFDPFDGRDLEDLSPAEREQVEAMIAEMAEAQRQVLAAPAAVVVANHAMGLFQLAALHLKQPEPDFDAARLAIDTMAGLLDAAGDRLGEDGATLAEGVLELQRAFVARRSAPPVADSNLTSDES
ncbi:MAG: hypothetical protein F2520_00090 [Actinobacteria bacterium]|uniref:Unannotated protein n=1 Tax=freshwater metagenome TaxID=449393 RepID=A0A6J7HYB4_9ZZZZ|nr:hypothetical protein [Actinomycetota bacterium]MTA76636.1 hypothetical protein [Actinomycetota bacterium]